MYLPHIGHQQLWIPTWPTVHKSRVWVTLTKIGAKHQKITPLWPQVNSEAENFMRLFKLRRRIGERSCTHFCSTTEPLPTQLLDSLLLSYSRSSGQNEVTSSGSRQKYSIVRRKDQRAKAVCGQETQEKKLYWRHSLTLPEEAVEVFYSMLYLNACKGQ